MSKSRLNKLLDLLPRSFSGAAPAPLTPSKPDPYFSTSITVPFHLLARAAENVANRATSINPETADAVEVSWRYLAETIKRNTGTVGGSSHRERDMQEMGLHRLHKAFDSIGMAIRNTNLTENDEVNVPAQALIALQQDLGQLPALAHRLREQPLGPASSNPLLVLVKNFNGHTPQEDAYTLLLGHDGIRMHLREYLVQPGQEEKPEGNNARPA